MSGTPEQPQFIKDVLAKRQQQSTRELGIEKAKRQLPLFRERIVSVLLDHFPLLDSDVPGNTGGYIDFSRSRTFDEIWNDVRKSSPEYQEYRGVRLECHIPIEDDTIQVDIASSRYPRKHKKRFSTFPGEYTISVAELDSELVLRQDVAVIRSKKAQEDARIYKRDKTLHESERDATAEDLQKYQELLDLMKQVPTRYIPHASNATFLNSKNKS